MATKRRENYKKDLFGNKDVTFYAIYIGSIPVERSMRTMQYDLRTAVTKEAIIKVCTAAKCLKQDIKRPKGIRQINKILPQPPEINRVAVNFTVSLAGLKSYRCDSKDNNKCLLNHTMASISFSSCGESPFKSFVGYVAKDPVRGRACHVFNCFGDAYDVVATIGEAFSIKYEDVLRKHSQCNPSFEFIEINDGFFTTLFEENTANNQMNNSDPNLARSKSDQDIVSLYENLPNRKALTSHPARPITTPSLLPRAVENSIFYIPKPEEGNVWPRTNYCPSPPETPLSRRKAETEIKNMDSSALADSIEELPVSSSEDLSTHSTPSIRNAPPSHAAPPHRMCPPRQNSPSFQNVPPTKPPRPKMPIYANIDDVDRHTVDRQTYGAASNCGTSPDSITEESIRATPEELRRNLEALECSLDEISSVKGATNQSSSPYSKMSWFHGKINREEAEHRLKYQGDYLVRSHGNGQFVLSCMDSGNAKHLLLVDPQGQIRTRDRKFVSITDLVTHYATSGECIVSDGCTLRIIRPVPQPP